VIEIGNDEVMDGMENDDDEVMDGMVMQWNRKERNERIVKLH